jgi:hypothetical protein
MDIDGLRCALCEYIDCIDDDTTTEEANNLYYGLRVVCSNIKIGDGLGGYQTAQDFETCNKEQIDGIGSNQGTYVPSTYIKLVMCLKIYRIYIVIYCFEIIENF